MANYNIDSQGNILKLLLVTCSREYPDLVSLKGFIGVVIERLLFSFLKCMLWPFQDTLKLCHVSLLETIQR